MSLLLSLLTSLQEFSQTEIVDSGQMIDMQKVNEERKRREVVLEMRHAVAKEVTRKSKESQEGMLRSDGERIEKSAECFSFYQLTSKLSLT